MDLETIPLSQLVENPGQTLVECADSGESLVIELPDRRLVAIRLLESDPDDSLVDELLASNEGFRSLIARSKAGPRKAFTPRSLTPGSP